MKTTLLDLRPGESFDSRVICGVPAQVRVDSWSELLALDTPSEAKAAEIVAQLTADGWFAQVDKDHPKSLDAFRAVKKS